MPDSYTVKSGDNLWNIAKQHKISFNQIKAANPALAGRSPPYRINPGDVIKLPKAQKKEPAEKTCERCPNCIIHTLQAPFMIAEAKGTYQGTHRRLQLHDEQGKILDVGQDITHGSGRPAPQGQSEGETEDDLKQKMNKLLTIFAEDDNGGAAKKLFGRFQDKHSGIQIFEDPALNTAVEKSKNFQSFSERVLGAPGTQGVDPSKTRIHQALKSAAWDINRVSMITGLGAPAFNEGSKFWQTDDWGNGLALMINDVLYVHVYVTVYYYNSCIGVYLIGLEYVLYDVFGLDDGDLAEYTGYANWGIDAGEGIVAWWQLQHQFDYAPLLTRARVFRTFAVPAK